jgi:hypothetical protein
MGREAKRLRQTTVDECFRKRETRNCELQEAYDRVIKFKLFKKQNDDDARIHIGMVHKLPSDIQRMIWRLVFSYVDHEFNQMLVPRCCNVLEFKPCFQPVFGFDQYTLNHRTHDDMCELFEITADEIWDRKKEHSLHVSAVLLKMRLAPEECAENAESCLADFYPPTTGY